MFGCMLRRSPRPGDTRTVQAACPMPRHLAVLSLHPARAQRSQRYHKPQLKNAQMRRRRARCQTKERMGRRAICRRTKAARRARHPAGSREAPSARELGGLARHRPSIGSVSSCAARVEICQKLPRRSRETCASVRNRSHPHAGHSSQPPHVPGEARRGGRTPSSRGQPASR